LYDVLGNKVRSITEIPSKHFCFSSCGLSKGIYFYKISTGESNVGLGKIVIE
jgi:hypothetical protein